MTKGVSPKNLWLRMRWVTLILEGAIEIRGIPLLWTSLVFYLEACGIHGVGDVLSEIQHGTGESTHVTMRGSSYSLSERLAML